jgi:hypothetical protein
VILHYLSNHPLSSEFYRKDLSDATNKALEFCCTEDSLAAKVSSHPALFLTVS